MREDYWDSFGLQQYDIEYLYNYLLETETPLTPVELVSVLVKERIRVEKLELEAQRASAGEIYLPKGIYKISQKLIFPYLGWRSGEVFNIRPGRNPEIGEFDVIQVAFDNGDKREFAARYSEHALNQPVHLEQDNTGLNPDIVLELYGEELIEKIESSLQDHEDFVRIAGKWFARALLVTINIGHLNLAEAVLDMSGGGPQTTPQLIQQIGLTSTANSKLLEFSLDLALQEDGRFDEVGASGEVLWFLRRLEPPEVLEPPTFLRYSGIEYDRSKLTNEMLSLELRLDDELSPLGGSYKHLDEVELTLTFPHWRAGTLPLSSRLRHLFPTAYESPRIRFTLVDGETKEHIPAWVVRPKRYVYGLKNWYEKYNLQPGTNVRVGRGKNPGEVIIHSGARRPSREWIRTVLVGSDGGVVFALLKQLVQSNIDDRMAIAVPDADAVDQVWVQMGKERLPFERVVVNMVRELSKLNPQGHVHASELYASVNVVKRCPPGPIMALLTERSMFVHLGDLHFRYSEPD
jgi:hypothetical protein